MKTPSHLQLKTSYYTSVAPCYRVWTSEIWYCITTWWGCDVLQLIQTVQLLGVNQNRKCKWLLLPCYSTVYNETPALQLLFTPFFYFCNTGSHSGITLWGWHLCCSGWNKDCTDLLGWCSNHVMQFYFGNINYSPDWQLTLSQLIIEDLSLGSGLMTSCTRSDSQHLWQAVVTFKSIVCICTVDIHNSILPSQN